MPRKRLRDWPVRVYKYGARLDTETPHHNREDWPPALRHVTEAQRDLWNTLVDRFAAHRDQYDALIRADETLGPLRQAIDDATQDLEQAQADAKAWRQDNRRKALPDDVALALARVKATLQHARAAFKAAKAEQSLTLRASSSQLLDTLFAEKNALVKDAPLPWYNARLVGDSFERSVKMFLKGKGGPPKPHHHLTQAHFTYHFTGPPLTWEQLCSGKTSMVSIAPVPDLVWDTTKPQSVRRRAGRTTGMLRITDDDTLTFRLTVMQRPPTGALIKGVELVGREMLRATRRSHSRWRWDFMLVCEIEPRTDDGYGGVRPQARAALDLNWRLLDDDSLRALTVYDGTETYDIRFPSALVQRWRFVKELEQGISQELEDTKKALWTLWESDPLPPDVAPPLAGWHLMGQGALHRLLRVVDALPPALSSRAATLPILERWEHRTYKLWREMRGVQGRLDRAKAQWYAETAKQLCTRYGAIAIEALDMPRMASTETEKSARLEASMQYRQLLGPGALLTRLTHTAQREGVLLVPVDPAWSTRTCPTCGIRLRKEDQTGEIWLECPQGHRYDQDAAGSRMIWERAFHGTAASTP
jgi:Putative transposase DNA-binding domain